MIPVLFKRTHWLFKCSILLHMTFVSGTWIPDLNPVLQDSGFLVLSFGFQSHKQKRFRFRIPDYIKVRYSEQGKRAICFAAKRVE